MEQTLKELAGDLQVIHESLERAEAVERQLGRYWREFAAERDQLRAQLETASGNARHYADRCTALEADLAHWKKQHDIELLTADGLADTVAGLRRALEEIANDGVERSRDPRTLIAHAALSASPADHDRRIKAEALRSTAAELEVLRDYIQTEVGPDDARDDIRRVCWNRAKDLREEADRLEAENGTR